MLKPVAAALGSVWLSVGLVWAQAPVVNGVTPGTDACRTWSDKAMAADMRVAGLQGQKADADQTAQALDEAIALWDKAVGECVGRPLDRAKKNLLDNQRAKATLEPALRASPECATRQKDASRLQELAQAATKERRWADAALLFNKAETMWDVAAERCSGDLRKVAEQRRDQSATDGHNAEHCAPLFDRARELTQGLSRAADAANSDVKQQQSQQAESAWREAIQSCKGQPQDIARQNAQRIGKERGTPWIPTQPVASNPSNPTGPSGNSAGASPPKPSVSAENQRTTTPPAVPAPPAAAPPGVDMVVGDVRFVGQFVREGQKLSGRGSVTWANGDRYEGELLNHLRHGEGEFTWANGQRYKGTWVNDQPQGRGKLWFDNGNLYEGDVASGKPHGQGHMTYASGDSFAGPFKQGDPFGAGRYQWKSGQVFEGPWSDGHPNGTGTLVFANGNRYEGPLRAGVPQGFGKLTFASGDRYEGQFQQGSPHGDGLYIWKSGDRYLGQWKDGVKHGQGQFEWTNGDKWVGEFANDAQTPRGELTRKQP